MAARKRNTSPVYPGVPEVVTPEYARWMEENLPRQYEEAKLVVEARLGIYSEAVGVLAKKSKAVASAEKEAASEVRANAEKKAEAEATSEAQPAVAVVEAAPDAGDSKRGGN